MDENINSREISLKLKVNHKQLCLEIKSIIKDLDLDIDDYLEVEPQEGGFEKSYYIVTKEINEWIQARYNHKTGMATITPSEIGAALGVTSRAVNILLLERGLQDQHKDYKDKKYWWPTEKGMGFCELVDTDIKRSNGDIVKQIRWFSLIVDRLKNKERASWDGNDK